MIALPGAKLEGAYPAQSKRVMIVARKRLEAAVRSIGLFGYPVVQDQP
ncbi:hypothetical protein [Nocardia sienata]|nr:hypothetical protein [Nocardia sienata]